MYNNRKSKYISSQLRHFIIKGTKFMKLTYRTSGTCARAIHFDVQGDTVVSVEFEGGCAGNTTAVSRLVEGRNIDEVIETLRGTPCGMRGTSCPDQLALALAEYKNNFSE